MGVVHVTATVESLGDPDKSYESLFLVDTGATDCLAPGNALRAAGINPDGTRRYELADGTPATFDIAATRIRFMGDVVGATVIFGPDDCEPLLGVTALESAGIEVDPRNQLLKRLPAVRLKPLRPR